MSLFRRWFRRLVSPKKRTHVARGKKSAAQLMVEHLEDRVVPTTYTWDGGGADGNMTTAANWVGDQAPLGFNFLNDDLVFPTLASGNTNYTVVNNLFYGSLNGFKNITFSGSGYNLTGANALSLTGQITVAAGAANNTISLSNGFTLGGTAGTQRVFDIGIGGSLTVSSSLVTTGSVGVAKQGLGTLTLGANNSGGAGSIGLVSVAQGVLQVSNPGALGNTAFNTTVLSGAELQLLNGAGAIPENIIVNGSGAIATGVIRNIAGNNTWTGNISMDSASTFGVDAGTLNVTGQVRDLGAGYNLTKEGSGTLIFSRDNTYRGLTTINDGVLTIRDPLALGAAFDVNGNQAAAGTVVSTAGLGKTASLYLDGGSTGFIVLNELLTLNSNGVGNVGALYNLSGNNEWASSVILGSTTFGANTSIGVNGDSDPLDDDLIISGVISGSRSLTKRGAGTLVLNNDNTFTNSVTVAQGALNIRDSRALGTGSSATVSNGATLELEVDSGFSPHGRDLAQDSVTGYDGNGTLFGTQLGLRISETITLFGAGVSGAGAIHSISGVNRLTGSVTMNGVTAQGLVTIGVETSAAAIGKEDVDPNAAIQSNTDIYFERDYSLTIDNLRGGSSTAVFTKNGSGHLILPNSNTYTGETHIETGWVTIQDDHSLGQLGSGADSLQPDAVVSQGAALHIRPKVDGQNFNIIRNLDLSGTGIEHPFALIDKKGALLNLGGDNTIGGTIPGRTSDIQLTGQVGIGVEIVGPSSVSQLTITAPIFEAPPVPINFNINATGDSRENSQILDATATSGTLTVNYDFLIQPDRMTIYYPPRGQPGSTLIHDTGSVANTGTINIPFGPGASTLIEIVVNEGGLPYGTFWNYTASIVPDVISGRAGINKLGSRQLILQGEGTYRGDNLIQEGVLLVQHDMALGTSTSGTSASGVDNQPNTYETTTTSVGQGKSEVQSLDVSAATGTFSLTFGDPFDPQGNPLDIIAVDSTTDVEAFSVAGDQTIRFKGGVPFIVSGSQGNDGAYTVSTAIFDGTNTIISVNENIADNVAGGRIDAALNIIGLNTDSAAESFTVAGDLSDRFTAGRAFRVTGSTGNDAVYTVSDDAVYRGPLRIVGVSDADDTFSVVGDETARFTVGSKFSVSGSTTNQDGFYTVGSVLFSGGNTYIHVLEPITDETVGISLRINGDTLIPVNSTVGQDVADVTVDGQIVAQTAEFTRDVTALELQNALNALYTVGGAGGSVVVNKVGDVFSIVYEGLFVGQNVVQLLLSETPTDLLNISAVSTSADSFTIVGDKSSLFTTGSTFAVSGSTVHTGTYTVEGIAVGSSLAISDVSTVAQTFSVAGDLRSRFVANSQFVISGSTGNDGLYTVVGSSFGSGQTTITVVETIPSAVENGLIEGNTVLSLRENISNGTVEGRIVPVVTTLADGDGAALRIGITPAQNNGGLAAGSNIWHEHLQLQGDGNRAFGVGAISLNNYDNHWQGPITFTGNTEIQIDAGSRWIIRGTIDDGSTPAGLRLTGGGELVLAGANTYRGTTFVDNGLLVVQNSSALGASSSPEIQTVTVSGSTTGTFTLSFNGATTTPISATATSTDVQNALNALPTIGAIGGTANVVAAGSTYTVFMGGTLEGFNQLEMIGEGQDGTDVTVATVSDGIGGTAIAKGAGLQIQGNLTINGESLRIAGDGSGISPDVPLGWFNIGPSPSNSWNGRTADQSVSGRVTGVVVDPADPDIIYISTAGGGSFRSINGGLTWTALFDNRGGISEVQNVEIYQESLAITNLDATAETFTVAGNYTSRFTIGSTFAVNDSSGNDGTYTVIGSTFLAGETVITVAQNVVSSIIDGEITGGTLTGNFTLTFDGGTTVTLPIGATATDVQNALNSLSSITGLLGTVSVTEATPFVASQYATSVIAFSSQFSSTSWSADQALGPPDTLSYGDIPTAWSPLAQDGGQEFLTLGYSTPVHASGVVIRETNSNGFVTRVDLIDTNGVSHTVFAGIDPSTQGSPVNFQISFPRTDYLVQAVKIYVDSDTVLGDWEEIDSVELLADVPADLLNEYVITFGSNLAATDVSEVTVSTTGSLLGTVTTIQNGASGGEVGAISFGGTIAIDPTDSRTLYLGTGESNNSDDSFYGSGVYKSTDSGQSWNLLTGVSNSNPFAGKNISRIIVNPLDPTELFVASGDTAVNATTSTSAADAPGIWRYSNGDWFNLTGTPDLDRQFTASTRTPNNGTTFPFGNPPGTEPGPHDNYAVAFAQSNAVWDDITLVNGVLVASLDGLGTFWTGDYRSSDLDNPPKWFTGTPGVAVPGRQEIQQLTITNTFYGLADPRAGDIEFEWNGVNAGSASTVTADATAAEIQAALGNITGMPTVTVVELSRNANQATFRLTFSGNANVSDPASLGGNGLNDVVAAVSNTSVTYAVTQQGSGPSQAPDNRPGGAFPASGNGTIALASASRGSINYISRGASSFSFSGDQRSVFPDKSYFLVGNLPDNFEVVTASYNNNTNITTVSVIQSTAGTSSTGTIHPQTFATVLASTANGSGNLRSIYRTTNGGRTWGTVASPNYLNDQGEFANSILMVDGNTAYAAGHTSTSGQTFVLRSTNGGANWTDISVDSNGVSPHDGAHELYVTGGYLYIATDGGLWRMDLSDDTWENITGNLTTSQVNSVASDPFDLNIIYTGLERNGVAMFDNSRAWTEIDPTVSDGNHGGGTVRVDPTNPNRIYAVIPRVGTNQTALLRRSLDGGQTWTTINSQLFQYDPPLVLDSINPDRLLFVNGFQIQESTNNGTNWLSLGGPLITPTSIGIAGRQGAFQADPNFSHVSDKGGNTYDPDTIYEMNATSIYLTKDHGLTWVDRTSNLAGLGSLANIVVDPRNRDTAYVVRNAFDASGQKVFKTTNAGLTWTDITHDLTDAPVWKMVIDSRNNDLYIASDRGVYQLKDGDSSWERIGTGMPNVQVRDLELNQTTNTLLAGTYGRGVYQMFLSEPVPNGGALNVVSGSVIWTGAVSLTGDVKINVLGEQEIQTGTSTAQLSIQGVIADSIADADSQITKVGGGGLILDASNVYGGETNIEEGTIIIRNPEALGQADVGTVVFDGAALQLQSSLGFEPVTVRGNGPIFNDHNSGALRSFSGDNIYSGPLTLGTNTTIGADSGSSLTITGTINQNTSEIQRIVINSPGLVGDVTFAFRSVAMGSPLPADVDAATLQAALEAISTIGTGNVLVTENSRADNQTIFEVQFVGTLGDADQALLTATYDNGVSNVQISTLAQGGSERSLSKELTGTLVISGDTSYAGQLNIDQGALKATTGNAFGTAEVGTQIRNAAQLQLDVTSEIQRITIDSPNLGGTVQYSFDGQSTLFLTATSTGSEIQAALQNLSTIGGNNVRVFTVSRSANQVIYDVHFVNAQGFTDQPEIVAVTTGGASASVDTQREGAVPVVVAEEVVTASGEGINKTGAILNIGGDNVWAGDVIFESIPGVQPATTPPNYVSIGANAGSNLTITGVVTDTAGLSGSATEFESNNTPGTANPISLGTNDQLSVVGTLDTLADTDYYDFTLSERNGVFFDIDAIETGLSSLNSVINLYSYDGFTATPIGLNDNGYDFQTGSPAPSSLASATSGDASYYADLLPGRYLVQVSRVGSNTGSYNLILTTSNDFSASVPALNSNPGASHTLYLDFDGHNATDVWGTYNVDPFDFNGDINELTPAEKLAIQNIWRIVAEDFRPFDINVTTVDPGTILDGSAMRAVITSDDGGNIGFTTSHAGELFASTLGSYVNSDDSDQTYFVFTPNFSSFGGGVSGDIVATPVEIGNTTSEGMGRALGLDYYAASGSSVSYTTTWNASGPAAATGGQVENITNLPVAGSVQAVAAHPTNPDVLYIGATNGGIWKTSNATATSPTWTALTDGLGSMSISSLEFDPSDATHQTLVAGIGRYSSLGQTGGARIGILRTTNGGSTWSLIDGGGTLTGKNISGVAARDNVIVASVNTADFFSVANTGIFRSTDGGASFTQISVLDGSGGTGLPNGVSYSLVADPSDNSVLYTSIVFSANGANGIYKSTDTGATWSKVSDAAIDALIDNNTDNVEIAVGNAGNVFAAVITSGVPVGIFSSANGGNSWTAMDLPETNENTGAFGLNPKGPTAPGATPEEIAGGQGTIHFSIIADPNDPNIVYVGGDRQPQANEGSTPVQFPNSIGANDFTGRLFRGDASQPTGSQWEHITHSNTTSNSAPHADSRDMAFDANGNLIEVDDGGIYRRTSPQSNTGDWFSVIGNLQVTEIHDVAYDPISSIIISGNQDTGTTEQSATGSTVWRSVSTADGGDVAVDYITFAGINQSIRYSSYQYLGSFTRRVIDQNNNVLSTEAPTLTVTGGGAALVPQFKTPVELNGVDPTRMIIIGENSIYESLDQGDTITEIGVGLGPNGGSFLQDAVDYGTSDNPDVIYVGVNDDVYIRTTSSGSFTVSATYSGSGSGDSVRDVVINPNNYQQAWVVDSDQVFMTIDAGANWTDVTSNIMTIAGSSLRTIAYVSSIDALVVGGTLGAFITEAASPGAWTEVGSGLPNALVYDLDYVAQADLLVAGTLGRGAWIVPGGGLLNTEAQDVLPGAIMAEPELGLNHELWSAGINEFGNSQDDLALIGGILGFLADDFGNDIFSADDLGTGNSFSQNGVIEQLSDLDYFKFTLNEETQITVRADLDSYSRNLDPVLRLLDSSGNQIVSGSFGPRTNLDFTASTLGVDISSSPPNTNGAVGPTHVVEVNNGNFEIFAKDTGVSLNTKTLDQFWIDAGASPSTNTVSPKIIFDTDSNRWFMVSTDSGVSNSIFIAVSASADPTGAWQAVSFQGDLGVLHSSLVGFGLDADGVYVTTDNYDAGGVLQNPSIFSIPKFNLTAATPTVVNMQAFRNLPTAVFGTSIQPVTDFGTSNGKAMLLSAKTDGVITTTYVVGAGAAGATLSGFTDVAVPSYNAAPDARQPGLNDNIDVVSGFKSSAVEANGSVWIVHSVLDTVNGGSALRWYEFDEDTSTLLQSGTISDANLDFYNASIAVNSNDDVVISFSGSGDSQPISSYIAFGVTTGGTTVFDAPQLVSQGTDPYQVLVGGVNRWGDYSATVVDPSDPDSFWTFQQSVSSSNVYSINVTQFILAQGIDLLLPAGDYFVEVGSDGGPGEVGSYTLVVEPTVSPLADTASRLPFGLTKVGDGKLTLTNDNGYSLLTDIQAGVLNIQNAGALGGANAGVGTVVRDGASLEFESTTGFTLDDEDISVSGNGPSGSGALRNVGGDNEIASNIVLSSTDVTADVATDSSLTVSGIISETTAPSDLTKTGAGTLILNAVNTYTGTTHIEDGTVQVNGVIADVSLDAGTVSGDGTVGTITTASTGEVHPGISTGTLTSEDVSWNVSTTFFVDLNGLIAGTSLDIVDAQATGSIVTVAGDQTARFQTGTTFSISGSTDNDGVYTVASSSFDGTNTLVVVNETVVDSAADGQIGGHDQLLISGAANLGGAKLDGNVTAGAVAGYSVTLLTATDGFNDGRLGVSIIAANNSGAVGTHTLTLAGNLSSRFTAGSYITVIGSPSNDGVYTVTGSVFGGVNTVVTIAEALPTSTAGGQMTNLSMFHDASGTLLTPETIFFLDGRRTQIHYSATEVVLDLLKTETTIAMNSNSPTVYGETATFTAQVSGIPSGVPTGSVDFYIDIDSSGDYTSGDNFLGNVAVDVNGFAEFTTAALNAGTYTIVSTYSGDANFEASSDGSTTHIVNKASTTTALSSSANPSFVNDDVTFTATIDAVAPGAGTPADGTVEFFADSSSIGFGTVSGGMATFSISSLTVGMHAITATYSGNSNFLGSSTGAGLDQQVNLPASTTTLESDLDPSVYGQSVTFTATVTGPTAPVDGTTVTFLDGGNFLGYGVLNGGVAYYPAGTTELAAGDHTITVEFPGDSGLSASTGTLDSQPQTVDEATTTTALTFSESDPSASGTLVTMTAVVVGQFGTIPTGTVTFTDSVDDFGTSNTVTVDAGGTATFSFVLSGGAHSVTATFNDASDPNHLGSSDTQSHSVLRTSTTVLNYNATVYYGDNLTLTATVSGGGSTPTGDVEFSDINGVLGSAILDGFGVATYVVGNSLGAGTYTFTADYLGNGATYEGDADTNSGVVIEQATTSIVSVTGPGANTEFGQAAQFVATIEVTNGDDLGTLVGQSIEFSSSLIGVLGSATILDVGGGVLQAAFSTTDLSVGSHAITATYLESESPDIAGSSASTSTDHVVDQTDVTVGVSITPASPTAIGGTVTITADVSGVVGTVPTGTVTFVSSLDGTLDSNVALVNGVATIQYVLQGGDHTITVNYSGDGTYIANSGNVAHTVLQNSFTDLTFSDPTATLFYGTGVVTLTATVTAGTGTPQGDVNFTSDIDGDLGTATLDGSGTATLVVSAGTLSGGVHSITADYLGEANAYVDSQESENYEILQAETSTSIGDPAGAVYGEPVTLTATLSVGPNGSGTPTGTMYFSSSADGPLGSTSAWSLVSGSYEFTFTTTAALSVGSHTFTASYDDDSADGNLDASNGDTSVITVGEASTTTTFINPPASPTSYGNTVTFTVTVAAVSPGAGIPTGDVQFTSNQDGVLGTATLSGGIAVFEVSTLSANAHDIQAIYDGSDPHFAFSQGFSTTHTVNPAATATAISSSSSSSVEGDAVTFTAVVTSGVGTPTGTVDFYSTLDGGPIGTGTVSGGTATMTTSGLSFGSHDIYAVFNSTDSNLGGSVSDAESHDVIRDSTTDLTISSATSQVGDPITLTAVVTSSSGVATGTVHFYDGSTEIGTGVTLPESGSVQTVTFVTTSLTAGTHSLSAVYSGDTEHVDSTSTAVNHQVLRATSATTVTTSITPADYGAPVTITATVAPASGSGVAPTGTVTFKDTTNNTVLGTVTITTVGGNQIATLVTNSLLPGTHSITATYNGNTNYESSVSAALTQVINPAPPIGLRTANTTIAAYSPFSLTVIAYDVFGGAAVGYNETVTIQLIGVSIYGTLTGNNTTITMSNGVATFNNLKFNGVGNFTVRLTSGSFVKDVTLSTFGLWYF